MVLWPFIHRHCPEDSVGKTNKRTNSTQTGEESGGRDTGIGRGGMGRI